MLPMHVFLIGSSGSGKFTLGKKAAEVLNLPFLDTDQRVGEMMGMAPSAILKTLGEEFFRNAEAGVLMELIGIDPCIIATGSGLPTSKENVQLMRNHGAVIHVNRPLDQIVADVKLEKIPDLNGMNYEEVVHEYQQRIGYYHACADYTLDNDRGPVLGLQRLIEIIKEIR